MVYDSINHQLLMFAGQSSPGYQSDIWRFNLSSLLWVWDSGTNAIDAPNNYGTLGVAVWFAFALTLGDAYFVERIQCYRSSLWSRLRFRQRSLSALGIRRSRRLWNAGGSLELRFEHTTLDVEWRANHCGFPRRAYCVWRSGQSFTQSVLKCVCADNTRP